MGERGPTAEEAIAALKQMTCPCDGDPFSGCHYVTVREYIEVTRRSNPAGEATSPLSPNAKSPPSQPPGRGR